MSRTPPLLLQDGTLGLRPPEPSDTEAYLAFRNDLGAAGDLIGFVRGVPAHKVKEWIATIDNRATVTLTAVLLPDQRPIGYVNIYDLEPVSGTCEMGLAVFAAQDRGKGHGRRMIELTLGYLRDWLNIRKVSMTVLADNAAAIALYKKCGFEIEGTLKDQYFIDGAYRSALLMAKFLR
jgi:RimJ/RimL family protein N-acetyltransferase